MADSTVIVTNELGSLKISPKERSRAPAEHDNEPAVEAGEALEDSKQIHHCNDDQANQILITTDSDKATQVAREITSNTLRPSLKSGTSKSPKSGKHVVIDPEVTILPTADTPIEKMPHNEHTTAEKRHQRCTYNRRSPHYKPSTWTSPDGYEKINTSHFKTEWEALERMNRALECSEASSSLSKGVRRSSAESTAESRSQRRRQMSKGASRSSSNTTKQRLSRDYGLGTPIGERESER